MKRLMLFGACVAFSAAAFALGDAVRVVDGVHAVMSPDGSRIAFQRTEGSSVSLGVCDANGGSVVWAERDDGCAAFPVWSQDGSVLYYAYGNRAHTAHENWRKGVFREGYTIRQWSVGSGPGGVDVLTRGLGIDAMPSLAPDGRTLWFCSNKPWKKYGKNAEPASQGDWIGNRICRATLGDPESGRWVVDYERAGCEESWKTFFGSPSVSPDGKVLMWAELRNLVDHPWGVFLAAAADIGGITQITPMKMSAYAPSWSPDGQHIVFTGCNYSNGDDGWYVYVQNPRQQWLKRICRGENATFTTDGRGTVVGLVYDLDGVVYRRTLSAGDFPTVADKIIDSGDGFHPWTENEDKQYSKTVSSHGSVTKVDIGNNSKFVIGSSKTVFCRVDATWVNDSGRDREFMRLSYTGEDYAMQVGVRTDGRVFFTARDAEGGQALVSSETAIVSGQRYKITGIRSGRQLWLSIDGAAPGTPYLSAKGFKTLNNPDTLRLECTYGSGTGSDTKVYSFDFGTGWPSNVPRPAMEDLDGFDWSKVNGGAQ